MSKPCKMALMNYTESNKKELKQAQKQLNKIEGEVGMAGSKSTQIRFVGIITFTIHPYACFLSIYMHGMQSNVTESELSQLHRGCFLPHESQEHSLKDSKNKSTAFHTEPWLLR